MLIQFQFLSLYKLSNTLFLNRPNTYVETTNNTLNARSSILTTNIHIFYLNLIFIYTNRHISSRDNNASTHFFFLPVKQKQIIFLRAPYKNKLARLNILKSFYKFIYSIQYDVKIPAYSQTQLNNLFYTLNNLNLSSHKIKHRKTRIRTLQNSPSNFSLLNFN